MLLLPLIYLKNNKAQKPVGTNPVWFRENPLELAKILVEQGAKVLYIQDLNVPTTGKSENLGAIENILKNLTVNVWVSGHFRSLSVIDDYAQAGVDKIVIGSAAYENPNFVAEAAKKWKQKIAAQIEVRNKRVVIPGMVAPAHKTALDYAKRFEENGVATLCYSDSDGQGQLTEENFKGIHDLCDHIQIPVLSLNDPQSSSDLERFFDLESAGLLGVVLGKSLYENRLDLHGSISFLDDLAVAKAQEPTLTED